MPEVRERCFGYVAFNDLGWKGIICFTQTQEIFLKLDFSMVFSSLDFILFSLELFIPGAATDQCKTIKRCWVREVMHSCNYYQPCKILKHDDLNENGI